MTEQNRAGLRRIRRALISVSDKTGIVEFAQALQRFDVELISTGGTARALREAGTSVRDISEVTGSPEMLDGRVKTLHPRIHGALLGLRDDAKHVIEMYNHGIEPIDMVVVNLYPFEQTIAREDVTFAEAIEQIDIGGPAMIRSAAKNFMDVAVITSPELYERIQAELNEHDGALSLATRGQLARLAFIRTAFSDAAIFPYLAAQLAARDSDLQTTFPPSSEISQTQTTMAKLDEAAAKARKPQISADENGEADIFPMMAAIFLDEISALRYGENPHQSASLYELESTMEDVSGGVAQADLLSGKEMSFNNYVDADAAWQLVCDFDETTCAIIKHTNPAGVGSAANAIEAYRRARRNRRLQLPR
jgi:phosphoribosylaminoimidazolecarboxamide formyltransferase / IMP cyclohydrolase